MYTRTVMSPETGQNFGTGWLPSLPDLRDYTEDMPEIADMAKKLGVAGGAREMAALPPEVVPIGWTVFPLV